MPESVLRQARSELLNYNGTGLSVMEMSHRSSAFQEIFDDAKQRLNTLLQVPNTHEILFLQGGATMQFAMVPMNLLHTAADYAVTGNFAGIAAKEAEKYGTVRRVCDTGDRGHTYIPNQAELKLSARADYFYYCSNNTIYGTQWQYVPETDATLVCDMSSDILSRPVDVSRYGLIFAGAQKNMAPAGLTVVIMRRDLAGQALPITPMMLDYQTMLEKDSMLNTPPCWCIYMLGLQLKWLAEQGGVAEMQRRAVQRSGLLYDYLDGSSLFRGCAETGSRSQMNITFRTGDSALDAAFVKGAEARGLKHLKGHRIAGGMRASVYNAMPMEGVLALRDYMREFEREHG